MPGWSATACAAMRGGPDACPSGCGRPRLRGTSAAPHRPGRGRRAGADRPQSPSRWRGDLSISPSQWVDNGPGWGAVLLALRDAVPALRPDFAVMGELKVGVIAPWIAQDVPAQFEMRAFVPSLGVPEDPVTGSLNAGRAQWLIGAGLAPARCVVSQGTVLGRAGRVHVCRDGPGLWIGGASVSCVRGTPDGVSGSRCSRTDRRAARRRRAGRR